jgi:hypothetical protein
MYNGAIRSGILEFDVLIILKKKLNYMKYYKYLK